MFQIQSKQVFILEENALTRCSARAEVVIQELISVWVVVLETLAVTMNNVMLISLAESKAYGLMRLLVSQEVKLDPIVKQITIAKLETSAGNFLPLRKRFAWKNTMHPMELNFSGTATIILMLIRSLFYFMDSTANQDMQ
jgi:hypothetical protein